VTTVGVMMVAKFTGLPLMINLPSAVSGVTTRYISTGSALLDNVLIVVELIVVLGISTLTYRYIELPGIALGKRWNRGRGNESVSSQRLPPRL